jgi:hypothetical protein
MKYTGGKFILHPIPGVYGIDIIKECEIDGRLCFNEPVFVYRQRR